MQGPRRKWRPRIVLLTVIFGIAAAAHIVALPVAALLGLAAMLWVAEGHRSQTLPVVLAAAVGALVLVFVCYGFSPDAYSYVFRSAAGFLWFSVDPARRFFSTLANGGVTVACCAALVLYLGFAQVALLRQHSSAVLRFGSHGACDDGLAGQPVAVVAAVSAYLYRRRLRRRIRRPPRTRSRSARPEPSCCCRQCCAC